MKRNNKYKFLLFSSLFFPNLFFAVTLEIAAPQCSSEVTTKELAGQGYLY
jgi:hypothetical protein